MAKSGGGGSGKKRRRVARVARVGRASRDYYGYSYTMNGARIYTVDEPNGTRTVWSSRGERIGA